MRVVLNALLERVEGFDLAGDTEWVRSNKHTGIRRMPVRYSEASSQSARHGAVTGATEGRF